MTSRDTHHDARDLSTAAWGLASVAAFAWLLLIVRLDGAGPLGRGDALAAIAGLTCTLAATGLAVVAAVRRTEARLAARLGAER